MFIVFIILTYTFVYLLLEWSDWGMAKPYKQYESYTKDIQEAIALHLAIEQMKLRMGKAYDAWKY